MSENNNQAQIAIACQNWWLSFGDLLTLVLCFFIAIAAQGKFYNASGSENTADNQLVALKAKEHPLNYLIAKVDPHSGIELADSLVGYELVLRPQDLKLKRIVTRLGLMDLSNEATKYRLNYVLLEACSSSVTGNEAESWSESLTRVLLLERALEQVPWLAGIPVIRSVNGPLCNGSLQPVSAEARVQIVGVRL